jgi:hypothetical protein
LVNKAWLGIFLFLFVVFFVSIIYDTYHPMNFGFGVSSPTPQEAGDEIGLGFIGSLIGAAFFTVILRVMYVGLKRLFS